MSTPTVSIVLPTFNGARYVAQAIESCLEQVVDDWELIIVDDASTDETPAIVADFCARDRRIRVMRHSVNRRLPAALNTGFTDARARYFTWISDDNLFRPSALKEMVAFLEQDSFVDVAYAHSSVIDEHGKWLGPGWIGPVERLPFDNVIGPCFLYRREVHERLGGYATDLFLAEDYDFWLRASVQFTFGLLNENLYLVRRHAGSLTARRVEQIKLMHEECIARNLPKMRWMTPALSRRAYGNLLAMARRRGARCALRGHLWQALWRHPSLILEQDLEAYALILLPEAAGRVHLWLERVRWNRRLRRAREEIASVIPSGDRFVLLDSATLGDMALPDRAVVPFVERDGQYNGLPADDASAIKELERLRNEGASWFVVAWPAFWFADEYPEFRRHLFEVYSCRSKSRQIITFDLRGTARRER